LLTASIPPVTLHNLIVAVVEHPNKDRLPQSIISYRVQHLRVLDAVDTHRAEEILRGTD
jgi:hypothetical protein